MKKILMSLVMVVGASAFGAESKIGFVDVQKAIQSTAAGKKAKESLDAEFQKRKQNLDKKKADIEKMGQDLEKKKSVLSEEVMNKKQMELQEEMLKFQKTVAENQVEIQKKEKDLVEPILEKMKKTIEKVAQEKGFTLVIEKQGQNVLFAQKDSDLTEDVVKAFEKEK
ncbi:MAG: OmpH outer membrane protein [Oligoflexia bacterium]|nr:MAG: OmpH outer membrane protein [Oligoflexia bacterium]